MLYIKLYAKTGRGKEEIIEWMIEQLNKEGELSLAKLLQQYRDKVRLINTDGFINYHSIGWNVLDIISVLNSQRNAESLELPRPKGGHRSRYTH